MSIFEGNFEDRKEGKFCGESEQIRTFYSEKFDVDVVFVTDGFEYGLMDYEFKVTWVEKDELEARFGPRPDLFPHVRGNLVANTYCERVFQVYLAFTYTSLLQRKKLSNSR